MAELPHSVSAALAFRVVAQCSTTRARASVLTLPHRCRMPATWHSRRKLIIMRYYSVVHTPIFMPVGTQGTLKGLTTQQLRELDCHLMLGNTYHLGNRPVRIDYFFWCGLNDV